MAGRVLVVACLLGMLSSPSVLGFQLLKAPMNAQRPTINSIALSGLRCVTSWKQRGTTAAEGATEKKSKSEIKSAIAKPLAEVMDSNSEKVFDTLESLKEQNILSKWNSQALRTRPVSQNELKRELKSENNLDELLGLAGTPDDLKSLTIAAFAASAFFGIGGSIIGGETGGFVYWVTYLGGGIPLLLLGVGSVAPGAIGALISNIQWQFDPTNTKERRIRHEAAHMLCGYMCGLPVEAYMLEPTPACYFYDRKEGNIADIEEWKKPRPFTEEEMAKLAVVCMSGLMGELSAYDKADGGQGDLEQLQEFFFRADGERMRKPNVREDMTRWGGLQALRMLEENKASFEALCSAMEAEASVEDCIAAIEAA